MATENRTQDTGHVSISGPQPICAKSRALSDAEVDEIANAARYERSGDRKAFRAGHYDRHLTAKAGKLNLRVPKLKGEVFRSQVIERCRRREESVEEALMEMYMAGVSTRRVDDISQLLWGDGSARE